MAEEKSQSRIGYIIGIGVLVAVVIAAVVLRGGGDEDADDDGADAAGVDGGDGDGATADGGEADGVEPDGEGDGSAGTTPPPPSNAGPAAPPDNPEECRAYCRGLAERGELGDGVTADQCISQVCGGGDEDGEGAGNAERVPTVGEPQVQELPDDCAAQCRTLHASGELRSGMSVDDCVTAMCSDGDEDEDE